MKHIYKTIEERVMQGKEKRSVFRKTDKFDRSKAEKVLDYIHELENILVFSIA